MTDPADKIDNSELIGPRWSVMLTVTFETVKRLFRKILERLR